MTNRSRLIRTAVGRTASSFGLLKRAVSSDDPRFRALKFVNPGISVDDVYEDGSIFPFGRSVKLRNDPSEDVRRKRKLKRILLEIARDSMIGAGAGALFGAGVDVGRMKSTPLGTSVTPFGRRVGRLYPKGKVPLSEYQAMKTLALVGAIGGALHGATPPH